MTRENGATGKMGERDDCSRFLERRTSEGAFLACLDFSANRACFIELKADLSLVMPRGVA